LKNGRWLWKRKPKCGRDVSESMEFLTAIGQPVFIYCSKGENEGFGKKNEFVSKNY